MTDSALAQWHRIVRDRDAAGLGALLADDVVFHSPVVHTPQVGKAVRYCVATMQCSSSRSRSTACRSTASTC
jgi:ketosteroid isomerase-like protein